MKLITQNDPRLRQKSQRVSLTELAQPDCQEFIAALMTEMKTDKGLGIAAPQVGVNQRIIVVEMAAGPQALVNPRILWKSWRQEIGEEGCLSVPGVYGLVQRSRRIWVSYCDPQGKKKKLLAKGLLARVTQHEIDHLNGILFIDRMIKEISSQY